VSTLEYQRVVGRKVAQERRRHGLSQLEPATLLNRSPAWVSELLATIADALELPLAQL